MAVTNAKPSENKTNEGDLIIQIKQKVGDQEYVTNLVKYKMIY